MEEVAVTSEEWIEREYDRIVAEHGEDGATHYVVNKGTGEYTAVRDNG